MAERVFFRKALWLRGTAPAVKLTNTFRREMKFKYNHSSIPILATDSDVKLWEKARAALPGVLTDLGQQMGKNTWRNFETSPSDLAQRVEETARYFELNLS